MTKQEFIRFLKMEAEQAKTNKSSLTYLASLIETELNKYHHIEIETDKNLNDAMIAIRDFASKNKDGDVGCCSDDEAVEIVMKMFGISKQNKRTVAADKLDLDILDLLG